MKCWVPWDLREHALDGSGLRTQSIALPGHARGSRPRRRRPGCLGEPSTMFFRTQAPAPRGEATTFEELLVMETADHGPRTGSADARGWRPSMEDAVVVDVQAVPGALTLAIFDGHGGDGVSKAGAQALGPRLNTLCATRPPSQYLAKVFPAMDAAIHSSSGTTFDSTGSTAVCVVVTSNEIACGWLGDSKALLGTSSEVIALSTDHKPTDAPEKARVQAAGGHVLRGRVNGVLAVSRALGDFLYKALPGPPERQLVSCAPDVTCRRRDPGQDDFLILACDGLWETMTIEQARALVRCAWQLGYTSCSDLAKWLVEFALMAGSNDNISCVVHILETRRLDSLSAAEVRQGCEAVQLAYPACACVRAVLPLRRRDVSKLDMQGMADLLVLVGLGRHAPAFAAQNVNGECFVEVVEREFVEDLGLPLPDAAFLALCLSWWDKTAAWP